jgi:dihydropteroate synthase
MFWKTACLPVELPPEPILMGVLNVTPDSFSDGGRWFLSDAAIAHAKKMIQEGAQIIDIGGESSRPGATPVDEPEELRRILPVIEALKRESKVLLSVDTCKPSVAARAIEAGAAIVNDIGGLRSPAMRELVAKTGAGVICMHMQGCPATMQQDPHYHDVVAEVRTFFESTLETCTANGIDADQIIFDPGIGFGKTFAHNLLLLKNLKSLSPSGRPLALGVSRKSFLSLATDSEDMNSRLWPTIALSTYAFDQNVSVLRVHEITPNAAAVRIRSAIQKADLDAPLPPA